MAGNQATENAPRRRFRGAGAKTLTFRVFLDEWESLAGDVSRDVDRILDWTNSRRLNLDTFAPAKPEFALAPVLPRA